jgi:L-2,4-diaminobutyric acid acetyltransferase
MESQPQSSEEGPEKGPEKKSASKPGPDNGGSGGIRFRSPTVEDGPALWQLVIDAGTLDRNSTYTYLLLCRDFRETSIVAERAEQGGSQEQELVGFVTGYRLPAQPDTLFVWQVGVAKQARGEGLASRLLDGLLCSPGCRDVRFLETTVTPSNEASRALFGSLARRLDADLVESEGFAASLFPEGGHEPEPRLRIGPFETSKLEGALER